MMLAESRDLSVATYSEESLICLVVTWLTFTSIAGGGPAGPFCPPLQATRLARAAIVSSKASSDRPAMDPFSERRHLTGCERLGEIPLLRIGFGEFILVSRKDFLL